MSNVVLLLLLTISSEQQQCPQNRLLGKGVRLPGLSMLQSNLEAELAISHQHKCALELCENDPAHTSCAEGSPRFLLYMSSEAMPLFGTVSLRFTTSLDHAMVVNLGNILFAFSLCMHYSCWLCISLCWITYILHVSMSKPSILQT